MLDAYEEVHRMARKLKLAPRPLWFDNHGCPRWEEPEEKHKKFIKAIRCQYCSQLFRVRLVNDVYCSYGRNFYETIFFSGKLPKNWHYGDPPSHPGKPGDWAGEWWDKGWDTICTGTTMNSIPEPEFDCWKFTQEGEVPSYREECLAEKEDDDEEEERCSRCKETAEKCTCTGGPLGDEGPDEVM